MKFKKRYEEKKFSHKSSLALEIGSIAHKGKELVAQALIDGQKPDYAYIERIVREGYQDPNDKRNGKIAGIDELKERYYFEWIQTDNSSERSYDEKLKLYFSHLQDMEHDKEWRPIACELPINFVFQNKYQFTGYIDKLEQNQNEELRIVDYKTSKKIYNEQDIKTPLQMVIYDYGIQQLKGVIPKEHLYDFILLGKVQLACTKGYLKRGENKLRKLFEELEQCRLTQKYVPKPSPLCHWCDYCKTNPNADEELKHECPYHSLWTPTRKTFDVNQKYDDFLNKKADKFWF